jgi:hypothetical protein
MSDRYKGAILSPTAPTVTSQSAGGIYTLSQQTQYQGQGVWPQAVNYPINNSLRFRSSASAYLNRTFSTGNRRTWTWSAWIKRGALGSEVFLFANYNATVGGAAGIRFETDNTLLFYNFVGAYQVQRATTQVFRDPSAWYHIVAVLDTTQATASDRAKLYVNGVQVTAFSATTNPTQNYDGVINYNDQHEIAAVVVSGSGSFFDGYMAEVNFIDGVALTPSSFGTTDAYGIWQPIPYTGAYGTNGFYLPFTDNSALTTSSNVGLGKDFSGNGNYWVTNGISITAGSTYDSMKDVPTNTNSNTANYSVLNPLDIPSNISVSNGNLEASISTTAVWKTICNTISVSSGKWYAEFSTNNTVSMAGIIRSSWNANIADSRFWTDSLGYGYYSDTGAKYNNSTSTSYGAAYTTNDIIGVALDLDNGTLVFYKNGVSQGTAFTGLTGEFKFAVAIYYSPQVAIANFGQRPFSYTPPTGFLPLNTYNLPTPTILAGNKYMDATTYTGNGGTQTVVNAGGFQPDMLWLKSRSAATDHALQDSVRGMNLALYPNLTIAEISAGYASTTSNGFLTAGAVVNTNGATYVGWQWKASNAAGVSNTQGTITSTVSANTTAGFSILTYTGNGTASSTVGHGLGVTPNMVIAKVRSTTESWPVFHSSLLSLGTGYFLELDSSGAAGNGNSRYPSAPSSTVVTIGSAANLTPINASGQTYVMYCFSAVAGYSAFGSYTGNASTDGPFIYTGFRPRYVMIKRSDSTADWNVRDTARSPYNVVGEALYPNLNLAEYSGSETYLDILSNGFKLRGNWNSSNASGGTYIYACFAENPFKIARAR